MGLKAPLVIRMQDTLRHRVIQLNQVFHKAIKDEKYKGEYRGVFPIKVNQLREVVDEIIWMSPGRATLASRSPSRPVWCSRHHSAAPATRSTSTTSPARARMRSRVIAGRQTGRPRAATAPR